MPSQVHQVFYVPDPVENFLNYVITTVPRDIYDLEDESNETIGGSYWSDPNEDRFNSVPQVSEHEIRLSRNDLAPIVVDTNTSLDGRMKLMVGVVAIMIMTIRIQVVVAEVSFVRTPTRGL
ncbi:hypothetical protein LXL04_028838 [Taraxacum kok-saghyz]